MTQSYDKIERPFGSHLEREPDNLIPDATQDTAANFGVASSEDGAGTIAPTSAAGSVAPVIKNESQLSDLWIQNTIKSLNWKPRKQGFYIDGATGYAEFANIFLAGGITATTGSIGGWTIEEEQLSSGNVKLQSVEERILMGAATGIATGTGIYMGKDGTTYKLRVGDPNGAHMLWDGTTLALQGGVVTSLGQGTDLAIMGWQSDLIFSATNQTTVAWSSGTLRFHNGVNYSISAGNTGVMSALTYIYLDTSISTTALQITTTASNAIGPNRVIIAVAQNNSEAGKKATFQAFGGAGGVSPFIGANQIAANSVTTNEIATNSITAAELAATLVYAGAITLDTGGHIKGGQTAYDTGNGFFLGYSGGTYKFSIGAGGQADQNLRWDGNKLIINGYEQTGIGTYGGDGSDGALVVTPGTTTLNAGQLYQFTSLTIQNGGILTFTGSGIAQILVQGDVLFEPGSTVELRWINTIKTGGVVGIHALESGNPKTVVTNSLGGGITYGFAGNGGAGGNGNGVGNGAGGSGGGINSNGGNGADGTTGVNGGGGGGSGGSNSSPGVAGSAAVGLNGGNGGNGPTGTGDGGDGGSGGGGTGSGNGGNGGHGGDSTYEGRGGYGGNGGDSGPIGGNGGRGGDGGDADENVGSYRGGEGGNGGDGYVNGGRGGDGGDGAGTGPAADGGRGGDGGNGLGNGGNGITGFGGRGGDGGDSGKNNSQGRGGNGGNGGDGYHGGDGGDGGDGSPTGTNSEGGNGGDGGNAYSGAIPLFIFAGGNMNLAGVINAHGGNGGNGGSGGNAGDFGGDAGNGGNGGDGSDVYLLCKGTFTNNGIIINTKGGRGGSAGAVGVGQNSLGEVGNTGIPGRTGRAIIGTLTV